MNRSISLKLLAALTLVFTLAAAGPGAQAADNPGGWISVYVPGADAAAPVAVQAQTRFGWATVAQWRGYLTNATNLGVPFMRWVVDPAQLGQGPYRAVQLSLDQKSIVAASDPFYIPGLAAINLAVTIGPAGVANGAPPAPMLLGKTVPAPPRQAPLFNAAVSNQGTQCNLNDCAYAKIAATITGVRVDSWIAVEWQDANGDWLPVPNWEGKPDSFDLVTDTLLKSFTVLPNTYGHGPFRWAVYAGPDGGVLGVSQSFSLPSMDGVQLAMQFGR